MSRLNKLCAYLGSRSKLELVACDQQKARSSRLDSGLALQDASRVAVPIRRYGGLMRRIILFASIVRGQKQAETRRR